MLWQTHSFIMVGVYSISRCEPMPANEPQTIAWTDGQEIHAVDDESEVPNDVQTERECDDSFNLDDDKIEQAKEDVDYVNQMLNGEF